METSEKRGRIMSKNFVREIDGINNINKQEFYTNKANDLLSTKEHNYIRKETQEYHCLTDNVKQTKASNVRYTDTTASPNVNYNLISVDNSQVPKTNTNTISALSLVSALEAKDQQIQKLENEIATLREKKPYILSSVYNTANRFSGSVFTTNVYNDEGLQRFYLTVFVAKTSNEPFTKIDLNLRNGNYNFKWDTFQRAMLDVALTDPNITNIVFDFDTRKLTITTNETTNINAFFNLKLDLYVE